MKKGGEGGEVGKGGGGEEGKGEEGKRGRGEGGKGGRGKGGRGEGGKGSHGFAFCTVRPLEFPFAPPSSQMKLDFLSLTTEVRIYYKHATNARISYCLQNAFKTMVLSRFSEKLLDFLLNEISLVM